MLNRSANRSVKNINDTLFLVLQTKLKMKKSLVNEKISLTFSNFDSVILPISISREETVSSGVSGNGGNVLSLATGVHYLLKNSLNELTFFKNQFEKVY